MKCTNITVISEDLMNFNRWDLPTNKMLTKLRIYDFFLFMHYEVFTNERRLKNNLWNEIPQW